MQNAAQAGVLVSGSSIGSPVSSCRLTYALRRVMSHVQHEETPHHACAPGLRSLQCGPAAGIRRVLMTFLRADSRACRSGSLWLGFVNLRRCPPTALFCPQFRVGPSPNLPSSLKGTDIPESLGLNRSMRFRMSMESAWRLYPETPSASFGRGCLRQCYQASGPTETKCSVSGPGRSCFGDGRCNEAAHSSHKLHDPSLHPGEFHAQPVAIAPEITGQPASTDIACATPLLRSHRHL